MNRKIVVGATLVALAVVMTAGTLVASNMGFKLNYQLDNTSPGVSKTGKNTLALPDNRQSGLGTAKNLMDDIGFASVDNIQRFVKATETLAIYNGRAPTASSANFSLVAGEAYFVKMKTAGPYIVVGSDDPSLAVTLNQPAVGVSKTGKNFYAYNYHQTAATAKQLMDDVGFASVDNIQRFVKATETLAIYNGRAPTASSANFSLTPGEGYFVKMKTTTTYTPSHY